MFLLPNFKLKAQVGQINHICSYFQYFDSFLPKPGGGAFQVISRGLPFRSLAAHKTFVSHRQILCVAEAVQGWGGVWVSNCRILVWSFVTLALVVVACSMAVFVFSPEGIFIPVVGPHPGFKPKEEAIKASQ